MAVPVGVLAAVGFGLTFMTVPFLFRGAGTRFVFGVEDLSGVSAAAFTAIPVSVLAAVGLVLTHVAVPLFAVGALAGLVLRVEDLPGVAAATLFAIPVGVFTTVVLVFLVLALTTVPLLAIWATTGLVIGVEAQEAIVAGTLLPIPQGAQAAVDLVDDAVDDISKAGVAGSELILSTGKGGSRDSQREADQEVFEMHDCNLGFDVKPDPSCLVLVIESGSSGLKGFL